MSESRSVFLVWTNEARWLEDTDWIVGCYFALEDIPEAQRLRTVVHYASTTHMALIVEQIHEGAQGNDVPSVYWQWSAARNEWVHVAGCDPG